MTKVEMWPPPDWTEVVITWTWIMARRNHDINGLFKWLNKQPGGRYHLSGKGEEHDFAFRFENPADAVWFSMNIPS